MCGGAAQDLGKAVGVEDVVAQGQGHRVVADEATADEERLRQSVGARLHRVVDGQPEASAVAQQALERGLISGRRDDEDLTDPRQHQGGERVVHHRLVVDRHELLTDGQGKRIESSSGAAGEDDALHVISTSIAAPLATAKRCRHLGGLTACRERHPHLTRPTAESSQHPRVVGSAKGRRVPTRSRAHDRSGRLPMRATLRASRRRS